IFKAKDKRIGTYSGGMKQRLGIAQALIHQPKLLILDEPVSALDPVGRREVLTLIENLKKKMTILFSTHILSDADEVCDDLCFSTKESLSNPDPCLYLEKNMNHPKLKLLLWRIMNRYTMHYY